MAHHKPVGAFPDGGDSGGNGGDHFRGHAVRSDGRLHRGSSDRFRFLLGLGRRLFAFLRSHAQNRDKADQKHQSRKYHDHAQTCHA